MYLCYVWVGMLFERSRYCYVLSNLEAGVQFSPIFPSSKTDLKQVYDIPIFSYLRNIIRQKHYNSSLQNRGN